MLPFSNTAIIPQIISRLRTPVRKPSLWWEVMIVLAEAQRLYPRCRRQKGSDQFLTSVTHSSPYSTISFIIRVNHYFDHHVKIVVWLERYLLVALNNCCCRKFLFLLFIATQWNSGLMNNDNMHKHFLRSTPWSRTISGITIINNAQNFSHT